tara:strand:- start:845 stop:1576 length:732 start_codon:yes stop_codon:yes gene_type:complete
MVKNYKILKVKDHTDSYYQSIDDLFDMPFRILINGKSQYSGKTTAILNLMCNPEFPYTDKFKGENIYICSNNKLDNKLKIMMDRMEIPESNSFMYDEDYLEMLYESLEQEFHEEVNMDKKPSPKLIVFDDCGYSGSLKSKINGIVSRMICNGRHLNLSQIYTSQKYSQCSTTLRTNITGAILFGTTSKEVDLITEDMSYLENKRDFVKLYRETTREPRSFLVVNFSNGTDGLYMDSEFKPLLS